MKVKGMVCFLLVGLLAAGSLSACGPTEVKTESGAKSAVKSDVTLTYAASRTWVNRNSVVDDQLNQKFEEETGIKVDFQISPDDQYSNVLQTKLSTGEVPDIFMVGSGLAAQAFKPDKYFADLSSEEWVSRYADYAKKITQINGKTVGFMTWCVDGYAILYNPEIYAKYKLSVPTTYEEFAAVCDTLLKNGITPVYETGKELWHWAAIFGQSGPLACKNYKGDLYADLNSNKVKLADIPELAAYLEDIKKAYDAGYFGKNNLSNSWDSAYEALSNGSCAGFVAYESWQTELLEKYPASKADTWEMYPIPFAGNDMYSPSGSAMMRVAYKDSKNLAEVKTFFNFLAKTENLNLYYDNNPALQPKPSFKEVTEKPIKGGKTFVSNSKGGSGVDLTSSILYWSDPVVGQSIQEMMLGTKNAKEVLESVDEYRQKMFDTTK